MTTATETTPKTTIRYSANYYTSPPSCHFGNWGGWAVYAHNTETGRYANIWATERGHSHRMEMGPEVWTHYQGGPKANEALLKQQEQKAEDTAAKLNAGLLRPSDIGTLTAKYADLLGEDND